MAFVHPCTSNDRAFYCLSIRPIPCIPARTPFGQPCTLAFGHTCVSYNKQALYPGAKQISDLVIGMGIAAQLHFVAGIKKAEGFRARLSY